MSHVNVELMCFMTRLRGKNKVSLIKLKIEQ